MGSHESVLKKYVMYLRFSPRKWFFPLYLGPVSMEDFFNLGYRIFKGIELQFFEIVGTLKKPHEIVTVPPN